MLGIPRFTDYEHDFNTWVRRLAPAAAVVFFLLAVLMQQFLRSVVETTISGPPESVRVSEALRDPGIDGFTLRAKEAVKVKAGGQLADWPRVLAGVEALAGSRTDRFRAAIVAGELVGKDAALDRLKTLRAELAEASDLRADIDAASAIYRKGRALDGAADTLIARHRWYGELIRAFGAPLGHPDRTLATAGIGRIERAQSGMIAVAGTLFLTGVVLLLGVLARFGRRGFRGAVGEPGRAPQLYLEMFSVHTLTLLLTVCVRTVTLWLSGVASIIALSFNELLIWSTALSAGWPAARGMSLREVAPDLGWTRGRGIATEVAWGIIAFLVMTPVVALVRIAVAILWVLLGIDEGPTPSGFRTFESPLGGSWAPVILGTMGAVILAPLIEETIFRGALYQYLRSRFGVLTAVVLSASVFGAIHPYAGPGVIQVACMGLVWGLLREWRGSLIAGVVAHALHNGMLSLFNIWTIRALSA